jgi:thiol-disulfide isomerase/thioredoxin
MAFKYLILAIALAASISCPAQKTDKAFITSVVDDYKKASSISYDIDYKIKYFDNDETTNVKANCKLIRDVADTLFGGKIWYNVLEDPESNFSAYYDLKYIHLIQHPEKEILRFDPRQGDTGPITGATQGEVRNTYFMYPGTITDNMDNYGGTLRDTLIDKAKMVMITFAYPNGGNMKNRVKKVFIGKRSRKIEKITYYVELDDQYQYNEWNLSNIKFNSVTSESLEEQLASFQKIYTAKDYQRKSAEEMKPLDIGATAPSFSGKLYSDGKEITLAENKGKIVLLDFWYLSCYPCAQAVPHLNNLQEKYKDDLVVIGLNPFDTTEKQLKKIPDFIARTGLKYTIAQTTREVTESYRVYYYPTLYIIDKNGIIAHSGSGFSDNLEKDLEEIIDGLLKK